MIFIDKLFGIGSMRKTVEEIKVNLAYRWFLGLAIDNGFIDTSCVFMDSTHQKACANKRKSHNEEVELIKKIYEDDLLEEINEVRKKHNKRPIKDLKKEEVIFDELTGEEIEVVEKKNIKVSDTDPECGNFHKGEKEECIAYSHQTACDKNGFILAYDTIPANIHDSSSFYGVYRDLNERYPITNISLDAGYKTPSVLKEIFDDGNTPLLPYTRPKTKTGHFKKHEYSYIRKEDIYICPNGNTLKYSTTDRKGYSLYRADKKDCAACPFKDRCTSSSSKTITRYVWEDYKERCEEIRRTPLWKELYPLRKQTIERDFAIVKENHSLRCNSSIS